MSNELQELNKERDNIISMYDFDNVSLKEENGLVVMSIAILVKKNVCISLGITYNQNKLEYSLTASDIRKENRNSPVLFTRDVNEIHEILQELQDKKELN